MYGQDENTHKSENLKDEDFFRDLGVDGNVILISHLRKK
jgi:hypothetical protein